MIKIAIIGSRRRNSPEDKQLIMQTIELLKQKHGIDLMLVSGGCPKGADAFAEEAAKLFDIPIKIFFPLCSLCKERIENSYNHSCNFKKSYFTLVNEYYERNKEVADISDCAIALTSKDRTGGTENTLKWFDKQNKKYILL